MTRYRCFLLCLLPFLLAASPYASPGPYPVSTKLLTLHDLARNRDIPIKIYYPNPSSLGRSVASSLFPCPVILFSHGLGGSREGYAYLGQAFASHGYISIHLSHAGSDTESLLRSGNPLAAAQRAAMDPDNFRNRPLDISFVIDQLDSLNNTDPDLKGLLDPKTVGVAGHSFGAYTVMACIGQSFPGAKSFADPRISAAIAMSSPTPMSPRADLDKAYAQIKVPCFHMTGTLDDLPFTTSKAPDRRIPFDHSPSPDTYLLTLNGGDHMTFSGHLHRRLPTSAGNTISIHSLPGTSADPATDAIFHPLIAESAVAFFDAYLKHDPVAKTWLTTDFPKELADHGTFEQKSPTHFQSALHHS